MRILLVGRLPHCEIGGVPVYTHALADALVAAGADVDVLFPGPAAPAAGYRALPCAPPRDVGWLGQRAQRFAEGFAVARAAAAIGRDYDLVNVQYGGAMDLAVVRRLLGVCPRTVVTAHCGPSWWHLRRTPALACRVLARAEAVLVLSDDQRALFAQHGVDPGRLHAAPALIEAAFFAPPPLAAARGDEGMYLGRIAPGKGIDTLVQALAQCRRPPVVRLVGPSTDTYRLQLMRLANALGVGDRLRWHRPVRAAADRRQLLAECRFVVHPTQQDVRPLALIEALAAGVPIAASALPGTLELLAGHGRTFAPGDAAALAACLDYIAAAEPDAGQLHSGRELAASYHPRRAAARFLELAAALTPAPLRC